MQLRALIVVAMFSMGLGVAACGSSKECTPGQQSTPGGVGDPCDQTNMQCLALQGRGIALCMPDGSFGQCVCTYPQGMTAAPGGGPTGSNVPPGVGTMVGSGTSAPGGTCGNNLLEAGEVCERGTPVTLTCENMLGPGAKGLVNCVNCKFDFSMCTPGTPGGGAGNGSSQTPSGGSGARR